MVDTIKHDAFVLTNGDLAQVKYPSQEGSYEGCGSPALA